MAAVAISHIQYNELIEEIQAALFALIPHTLDTGNISDMLLMRARLDDLTTIVDFSMQRSRQEQLAPEYGKYFWCFIKLCVFL